MFDSIEHKLGMLADHYVVVCLFLTLFILTLVGVGNTLIVAMLGLILCVTGMAQQSARADLWILIPLIFYNIMSAASSYRTFGEIVSGYASVQIIFPVVYLLMAALKEKELEVLRQLCCVWVGVVAVTGMGQYILDALDGNTGRFGGILGNPNAMGIFLVIGWFALVECDSGKKKGLLFFLPYIEPVLLIALALTMSMGSFTAMAAGIVILVIHKKRKADWRETFLYGCRILAKAGFGIGIGVLIYLAADRTGRPWICLPLFLYALAVCVCWRKFKDFLEVYPRMAVVMTCLGMAVAITVITARPNAVATFEERLEMIRNGIGYLTVNPLLGVGPYQWRILNLHDSDKYFNTYHIHNVFVHVGVEFGLIAMALLAAVTLRVYRKSKGSVSKAGFTAFLVHNLMDTSFFYMGITAVTLLTTGDPGQKGTVIRGWVMRIICGCFAVVFVFNLYYCLKAG